MNDIQLPAFIKLNDFREFNTVIDILKQFGLNNVDFFEMGVTDEQWCAVFYQGNKDKAEKWFKKEKPDMYKAYTAYWMTI